MEDLQEGNTRVRDDYLRTLISKSGRVGKDGARTYHCHFGSTRVTEPEAAGAAIDYLSRLGDFAPSGQDRQDLEYRAGDIDALRDAAEAVAEKARWRSGDNAERVLLKITFELPAIATAEQRQAVADAIVADWQDRGHQAIAAVHCTYKVQPHVHVAVSARPVTRTAEGWEVDRTQRVLVGKAAVQGERARISKLINALVPESKFHPGRLRDTGIERKAKKRVPSKRYYQDGQRERDPEKVAEKAQIEAQRREDGQRKRETDEAARKARQEAKLAPLKAKLREDIEDELMVTRPPLYIEADELISAAREEGIQQGRNAVEALMPERIREAQQLVINEGWREIEKREEALAAETKRANQYVEAYEDWKNHAEALETQLAELKARPDPEPPATMKQIRYLSDLTGGKHELLADDAAPTRGAVGQAIRQIEEARAKAARDEAAAAAKAKQDRERQARALADRVETQGLRLTGRETPERLDLLRDAVAGMEGWQVVASQRETVKAMNEATDWQVWTELKSGLEFLCQHGRASLLPEIQIALSSSFRPPSSSYRSGGGGRD